MDLHQFWQVVSAARNAAREDPRARIAALREQLADLLPDQLQAFQNHYDQLHRRAYRWDLWGAAYIINGGCSDDGFAYFRDWLISEGRETYEAALLDPESLADLPRVEEAESELYGYVALELFEKGEAGELDRSFAGESGDPTGEPWDEDSVYDLYPRLAAKYAQ